MDLLNDVEDDDDTHICLKCHTTIIGLNNYVAHRKNLNCKRDTTLHTTEKPELNIETLATPDNPESLLRADDFFSSLELQSSAKTPLSRPTAGILTRSKANAVILASGTSQTKDVNEKEGSWIGGHSLKVSGTDNHSKLIKAVDNISKKDEPSSQYQYDLLNDYKGDVSNEESSEDEDESDEEDYSNVPPRTHTGGKWKPRSSPIQWMGEDRSEWQNSPPPTHTGGKWKPSLLSTTPPLRSSSHRVVEKDEDDMNHQNEDPPPNYTKGKWVPGRENSETVIEIETKPTLPLTFFYKGKWVTLDQKTLMQKAETKENSTYCWCFTCKRKLASKLVFRRHLQSDLHKKRAAEEAAKKQAAKSTGDASMLPSTSKQAINTFEEINDCEKSNCDKGRKNRKRVFIKCEVCRVKVAPHLIGKHLVSHYHWRKNKQNKLAEISDQMVLEYIYSVVRQSPFQCNGCKYYCNTETEFLNHWNSEMHHFNIKKYSGHFWCFYCEYACLDTFEMERHLRSDPHQEVLRAINRSVPIIICKRSLIECRTCLKSFRFNIQLKKHCQVTGHTIEKTTASLEYQEKYSCSECGDLFRSAIIHQRHMKKKHKQQFFVCSNCDMHFSNLEEAKNHRRTPYHKFMTVLSYNKRQFIKADLSKKCSHCYQVFPNIFKLKEHLRKNHMDSLPKCPQCGMIFTLSQEVSAHVRSKSCVLDSSFPSGSGNEYKCKKCPFRDKSHSEYLFHEALHRGPEPTSKERKKYKCQLCFKLFKKGSLKGHLRIHTSERPFTCEICSVSYVRKHNLKDHIKNMHHIKDDKENVDEESDVEACSFLCTICKSRFKTRSAFSRHKNIHHKTITCPEEGCSYVTRTWGDLQPHLESHGEKRPYTCDFCLFAAKTQNVLHRHMKVHSNVKDFECPHCDFKARMAFHLRKHMRIHTGAKPYKCPHCNYRCTALENLRKHVLYTYKHPDKCLYECKFCDVTNGQLPFANNFAKEFRLHLMSEHPNEFNSSKDASSYIAGIYNGDLDPIDTDNPIKIEKRPKNKRVKTSNITVTPLNHPTSSNLNLSPTFYFPSLDQAQSPILSQDERVEADSNLLMFEVVETDSKEDSNFITVPANISQNWNIAGCYGVEESGILVPFETDENNVFIQVD